MGVTNGKGKIGNIVKVNSQGGKCPHSSFLAEAIGKGRQH